MTISSERRETTSLLRQARDSRWAFPIAVYVATRAYDAVLFLVLGRSQIALPYGVEAYHLVKSMPADPGYWLMMTNWDGQWFQDIAENGYPHVLPRNSGGEVFPNSWAFYPLYPFFVRAISAAVHLPFEIVAPIISTCFGGAAVVLLYRMLLETTSVSTARATVLALCCTAAAPMLQVAYPDALALLLILMTLHYSTHGRYVIAGSALLFASLTRPIALPIGVTFLVLSGLALMTARRGSRTEGSDESTHRIKGLAILGVWGVATSAIWPGIAAVVTGSPTAYLDTMRGWVGYSSTVGTAWVTYLANNGPILVGIVTVLGCIAACLFVTLRAGARAWGPHLRAWTGVYTLYILITTSRPALGTLRHLLLAPVVSWPLPLWATKESAKSRRRRVLLLFALCVAGLCGQYLWISQVMTFHTWPTYQPGPP